MGSEEVEVGDGEWVWDDDRAGVESGDDDFGIYLWRRGEERLPGTGGREEDASSALAVTGSVGACNGRSGGNCRWVRVKNCTAQIGRAHV